MASESGKFVWHLSGKFVWHLRVKNCVASGTSRCGKIWSGHGWYGWYSSYGLAPFTKCLVKKTSSNEDAQVYHSKQMTYVFLLKLLDGRLRTLTSFYLQESRKKI